MNQNDFKQNPSVEAKPALTESTTIATLSSSDVIPTTDTTVTHNQHHNSAAIIESIKVKAKKIIILEFFEILYD